MDLVIENGQIIAQQDATNTTSDFSANNVKPQEEKIEADTTLSPEIEANIGIFDEHFVLSYAKSLAKYVITPLEKYYFRAVFIGFDGDQFPTRNDPNRPLIFASNHSGMAFPWDGIIFASGLMRRGNYDLYKAVRGLSSPMLSKTKLMNPFLLPNFWKRAGGIDATTLNFDTLMHYSNSNILIYPEGIEGIGKGFDRRYELQKLSTSSLRMSLKYKTDIIPIATVNAEYVNPFSYSLSPLNELVRKIGIPFLPLGLTTLLVLVQPWMFYFAFPAKLIFVRGRRIKPYEMLKKSFEDITYQDLDVLRNKIHRTMQMELDMAVREYGQDPYHWNEFIESVWQNLHKIHFFIPITWAFVFTEHDRRYYALQEKLKKYNQDTPEHAQARRVLIEEAQADVEDESILGLVKNATMTLVANPQVLLFYLPVGGLVSMFLQGMTKE